MQVLEYPHITIDDKGRPLIEETRTKVSLIVGAHLAYGWDACELQHQYSHLSLGQIHAALGYYYDHREEMDRQFQETHEMVERMRREQGETPLHRKLRELRHIP